LIGDEKQIAIFDVNEAKVVKYLPVASGSAKIAAGMNKLVVAYSDSEVLTRFDLTTFEKELTAKLPVGGTLYALGMGSASAGPLFIESNGVGALGRKTTVFVDLVTFKQYDVQFGGFTANRDIMHYRFSPDGRVVGSWCTSHSPGGLNVSVLTETGF